jgi:hypothetical protein
VELESQVEGPNGLRANALKYGQLKQVFDAICSDTTFSTRAIPTAPTAAGSKSTSVTKHTQKVSSEAQADTIPGVHSDPGPHHILPTRNSCAADDLQAMNPARARLISGTCLQQDPNRDLYEAECPNLNQQTITGSNNIPLGMPQAQMTASFSSQKNGGEMLKRKQLDNSIRSVEKQPRLDCMSAPTTTQPSFEKTTTTRSLDSFTEQGWEDFTRHIHGTVEILRGKTQTLTDKPSEKQPLAPRSHHETSTRPLVTAGLDSESRFNKLLKKPTPTAAWGENSKLTPAALSVPLLKIT